MNRHNQRNKNLCNMHIDGELEINQSNNTCCYHIHSNNDSNTPISPNAYRTHNPWDAPINLYATSPSPRNINRYNSVSNFNDFEIVDINDIDEFIDQFEVRPLDLNLLFED